MQITRLDIRGFGVFSARSFAVSRPLVLFYGPNEAGKSTLLNFICAVLFGFPQRQRAEERFEPISGGAHGGAIIWQDKHGGTFRVERNPGKFAFCLPDGRTLDEQEWKNWLGGMDAGLFRSLFAISLSELQEMRTLQSGELGQFLFHAGIGAGIGSVTAAEKRLTQVLDRLYKPRGKNQEINRVFKLLDDKKRELRAGTEQIRRYRSIREQLGRLEEQIAAAEAELAELSRQLAWAEKCRQAGPDWLRLQTILKELGELPAFEHFPAGALGRFEALLQEKERLAVDEQMIAAKIAQLREKIAGIRLDADDEAKWMKVDQLWERLASYLAAKDELADTRRELAAIQEELDEIIGKINPLWTEANLRSFSTALSEREAVLAHKERLEREQRKLERLEAELEQARQRERTESSLLAETEQALAALKQTLGAEELHGSLEESSAIFSSLARELEQYRRLSQEAQFARDRADGMTAALEWMKESGKRVQSGDYFLLALTVSFGLAVPFLLFRAGETALGLVSAAVLAAGGIAWWFRRRGFSRELQRAGRETAAGGEKTVPLAELREKAAALEQSLRAKEQRLHDLYRKLKGGVGGTLSVSETVRALEAMLGRWEDHQQALRQTQWKKEQQRKSVLAAAKQRTELAEELRAQAGKLAVCRESWEKWLKDCGLNERLSPDTALEIFHQAERGKRLLLEKEKRESKIRLLESGMAQFARDCREQLGISADASVEDELRREKARMREQEKLAEEKRGAEQLLSELAEQHGRAVRLLAQAEQKITALMNEAGAKDEEQFRFNAACFEQAEQLRAEKARIEVYLQTLAGKEQFSAFCRALADKPSDHWQQEAERTKERISRLTDDLNRMKDQRGRWRNELEALQQGEELAANRQLFAEQVSALHEYAREWAVHALCRELFRKAKELYEQERQPAVLQKASEYFRLITEERYVKVLAPLGEKRIVAERNTGERLDPAVLSRGTREQLFLAMRFALAEQYALPLPFILDDIFVNFDQKRLENTLRLLTRISASRQVLMLTCHRHVREAVERMHPDVQIIGM